MHTSNLYYLYLYSHFRVNGKRPLHIFFLCVVMCHCQCTEPHTTGLFGLGFFPLARAADPGGWRRPVRGSPAGLTAVWYAC